MGAMLGDPNIARVRNAPCVAVFCADLEIVGEIRRIQDLWRRGTDAPPEYINSDIPMGVTAMSLGISPSWLQAPLGLVARTLFALLSRIKGAAPGPHSSTAWAYKQTSFAAAHLVLAA